MTPFASSLVARVFDAYPGPVRRKLLALRELIFSTASEVDGVGPLEEALKWGEPAYLTPHTGSGTTIRIGWKPQRPGEYALLFNCRTTLIDGFRLRFPNEFRFEGTRALILDAQAALPRGAVVFCIATALTYHRAKARR